MNQMDTQKNKKISALIFITIVCSCIFWFLQLQTAEAAGHPRVVAHGCGSIQGDTVTNSLEALNQAIAQGYQYIEVDMALTSDGQIAMIHDWESSAGYYLGLGKNEAVSFEQYQKCKVLNKYTPMTLQTLAEILQKNPQVRIITDTKENNVEILTKIKQQQPQMVKQLIPQIYQYEEYEPVNALGYEDVILTLYRMTKETSYGDRIAKFALEHDLYAVTMSYDLVKSGLAKTLQSYGVAVYMHTVNSLKEAEQALDAGAYGVYTDVLLPEEVTYPSWHYYLANSSNSAQQLSIELQQHRLKLNMCSSSKEGSVAYYIGQTMLVKGPVNQPLQVDLNKIDTGEHKITARIYDAQNQQVATKTYLLWKDQSCALLLAPQYQYILSQFSTLGDFSTVVKYQEQRLAEIAAESFFVKSGSAVYYNNGQTGLYLSGNTLLPVIAADSQGNLYTSLYDTAMALGASNVKMNQQTKAMDITYQGKKVQADIAGITRSYKNGVPIMQAKAQLYRNRAMAGGALYQELTGRQYIQQKGYLILLPKGVSVTEVQKEALLEIAAQLYQQPNI